MSQKSCSKQDQGSHQIFGGDKPKIFPINQCVFSVRFVNINNLR